MGYPLCGTGLGGQRVLREAQLRAERSTTAKRLLHFTHRLTGVKRPPAREPRDLSVSRHRGQPGAAPLPPGYFGPQQEGKINDYSAA
jgi:hypothetical protein